jgi:hypothetical protein
VDEPVTILGYHGTSRAVAEQILQHGYQPSRNDYDWLGDGIYFWQDAPRRAWEWAERLLGIDAAVLVSKIELGNCLDFVDIDAPRILSKYYEKFSEDYGVAGIPLPEQKGKLHRLDRQVINYTTDILDKQNFFVQTVRGAFREGQPIYPNSAIYTLSHVQIAVRDASVILETRKMEGV